MDIFTVDSNFDRIWTGLIDDYDSLVWTERWYGAGDFKLVVPANYTLTRALKNKKYIMRSDSNKIMRVETAKDAEQTEEGVSLVELSGRSMESILYQKNNATLSASATAGTTGKPGAVAEWFVERYAINPATAQTNQAVSELEIGAISTAGVSEKYSYSRGNIYEIVDQILKEAGLGWSIEKIDSGTLWFSVRDSFDRTNPASSLYREFSGDLDSLESPNSLESVANYKNHCRVFGTTQQVDVYAPGTSSSVSGLDRYSMFLHFSDVNTGGTMTTTEEIQALRSHGRAALRENGNRYFKLIDGEIPPHRINELQFNLGDLVVVKDTYGDKATMRIVEMITTHDRAGLKVTPTFELVE